jgi:hypothetical protein
MSPIVRGHAIAQVESSGRTKKSFDVLLWTEELLYRGFTQLDAIQQLREYLSTIFPQPVSINLWLPEGFAKAHTLLNAYAVTVSVVPVRQPDEDLRKEFGEGAPAGICEAAATAASCDADMVVTENPDWFPFFDEFEKRNIFLGNPDVLLRQCEIYARGHDVTWAFKDQMFDAPWSSFYFFAEHDALTSGVMFLDACHRKRIDVGDIGRSLVYNRLPNIFFTRDRLLFYEMQQRVAKRANWQRQKFAFEIPYHLNFYYVLLFGGFDHLAVLLNVVLNLELGERDVAATGKPFLTALKLASPQLHGMFTDPDIVTFIERIASLRHLSAHRGQIAPGPVYERPDHEPTLEELDAEITAKGLDADLEFFPAGAVREAFRDNIRYTLRLSKYKLVLEDVVIVDGKTVKGLINPLADTEYNFSKFHSFLDNVLNACTKELTAP